MAVLLALALHGLLAAGLLLTPKEPPPPETIIDVVLAPPWRPRPPLRDKSRDSHLPVREPAAERADKPANSPAPIVPRTASDSGAWQVRESGAPEQEGVRRSLRTGVGCRSADFLSLTKAEREACDEKLAAGAKDAPAYAVLSPRLKKEFDGVFECPEGDVWCEYRIGKAPYPGLFAPRKKRTEWD